MQLIALWLKREYALSHAQEMRMIAQIYLISFFLGRDKTLKLKEGKKRRLEGGSHFRPRAESTCS